MATERLYYVNQYLTETTARVVSCEQDGRVWRVALDRTIFFPTGGGQPCDRGTIDAAKVLDVFEDGDVVIHLCTAPLAVDTIVSLRIDWDYRFMLMQQHSGEHLLSGIVHARFGYDNVGFHMGADVITIDFSGELSAQELSQVERSVNEAIWRNLPVRVFYHDAANPLPYRSKKEINGAVRLVQMGEDDLCACCGTHVARTGEIGLVKILSNERFHGGSRITLLSGGRAWTYLSEIFAQNREISAALSAKPLETAAAVHRLQDEQAALKYRLIGMENRLLSAKSSAIEGGEGVLLFEDDLSPALMRQYAELLSEKCSGAVFSGSDGQYRYVLFDRRGGMKELASRMNAALNGRGGGKPDFVQGSLNASRSDIEAFFSSENRL